MYNFFIIIIFLKKSSQNALAKRLVEEVKSSLVTGWRVDAQIFRPFENFFWQERSFCLTLSNPFKVTNPSRESHGNACPSQVFLHTRKFRFMLLSILSSSFLSHCCSSPSSSCHFSRIHEIHNNCSHDIPQLYLSDEEKLLKDCSLEVEVCFILLINTLFSVCDATYPIFFCFLAQSSQI